MLVICLASGGDDEVVGNRHHVSVRQARVLEISPSGVRVGTQVTYTIPPYLFCRSLEAFVLGPLFTTLAPQLLTTFFTPVSSPLRTYYVVPEEIRFNGTVYYFVLDPFLEDNGATSTDQTCC
ncbi:hypothetical protein CBL_02849 [Carabus blaptoides fortunei]